MKPLKIEGMVAAATSPIIQVNYVSFRYDDDEDYDDKEDWIFQYVDASIDATDRMLLRGGNGCGKTTLVNLIWGKLEPWEGEIHRSTANILYFPQTALHELLKYHGRKPAMEFLDQTMTETQARTHLGNFGLAKDLAVRKIHT